MTHDELIEKAEKWLYNTMGCGYVITEMAAAGVGEEPDAIGFRSMYSILVECKASRSDFFADKKKMSRLMPELGIGNYRYYMSKPGIIEPDDLPENWGLLHVKGRRIYQIVNALNPKGGNIAQPDNQFKSDMILHKERKLMYSALRRIEN